MTTATALEYEHVHAVVVLYQPDAEVLKDVLGSLLHQVGRLWVVSNSALQADVHAIMADERKVELLQQDRNIGIGAAQNAGIVAAQAAGAQMVLLSDQDTIYPLDYLRSMLAHQSASQVLCPLFVDRNAATDRPRFIRRRGAYLESFEPSAETHEVYQCIASGMLIPVKAFDLAGLMREDLFMDWVDLEWCWRANSVGVRIVGVSGVSVDHRLGDSSTNIGFRAIPCRSSTRSYYITRNAVHLSLATTYLPFWFRVNLLVRSLRYVVGFPLFCEGPVSHLFATIEGMLDGVRGRLGPRVARDA